MDQEDFAANEPFKIFKYTVPAAMEKLHIHNCLELGLVIRGKGIFYIENKKYNFKKNDLFLINSTEAHRAKAVSKTGAEFIFVFLSGHLMESISGLLQKPSYFNLYTLTGPTFKNIFQNRDVAELVNTIHDMYYAGPTLERDLAKIKSMQLILLISNQFKSFLKDTAQGRNTFSETLARTQDFINQNLSRKIQSKDLARISGLSESHFRKNFKKYLGLSPNEYILQRRLREAYILLRYKKISPQMAAIKTGFQNYSYFFRCFKKEYARTPSETSQLTGQ